jgi:transposase Tn5 family protein
VTLDLPPRKTRPARTARLAIRFALVPLAPPPRHRAAVSLPLPRLSVYAVPVKELAPPPDEPAVEWRLLTNVPVHSFADAGQRVTWYQKRWHIEEFHKMLKSGCRVEPCRLQTAQRLIRYVTLDSVIAWRVYWFTFINRTAPTVAATTILTADELAALPALTPEGDVASTPPLTVRDSIRRIAKLGGFLGRRHDGEPGITVIWRGWPRLSDFALLWSLVTRRQLLGNS